MFDFSTPIPFFSAENKDKLPAAALDSIMRYALSFLTVVCYDHSWDKRSKQSDDHCSLAAYVNFDSLAQKTLQS